MFWEDYAKSFEGRVQRYLHRQSRKLYLRIHGIEPRGKGSMPAGDRLSVQRNLLSQMRSRRRCAYRGPLVLKLRVQTTDKAPSHAHTIAKNLLDLFGKPLPSVSTSRRGIVYFDDRQVHALSVSCEHGSAEPAIHVEIQSLSDFRQDLALARHASSTMGLLESRELRTGFHLWRTRSLPGAVENAGGDQAAFELLHRMDRQELQRSILQAAKITPTELAYLYRAYETGYPGHERQLDEFALRWEKLFELRNFRMTLTELPQRRGTSEEYRREIDENLYRLSTEFRQLLVPLYIPLALEIVIKPPPPSRTQALHDLDNVLRTYLIPRVVETFAPPSDVAWVFHSQVQEDVSTYFGQRLNRLPKSARLGLIRFEAWRIPRAQSDQSPGFVGVSVVADDSGYNDTISSVYNVIDTWRDKDW